MQPIIGISPRPKQKDRYNEIFYVVDHGNVRGAVIAARRAYPRRTSFYAVRSTGLHRVFEPVDLAEYPDTDPAELSSGLRALEKAERMVLAAIPHAKTAMRMKFERPVIVAHIDAAIDQLEEAAADLRLALKRERGEL